MKILQRSQKLSVGERSEKRMQYRRYLQQMSVHNWNGINIHIRRIEEETVVKIERDKLSIGRSVDRLRKR